MTSVFKIHDTVLRVSSEAQTLVPEIPVMKSENRILSELILCILSSQEKYEVALAMMKKIKRQNILQIPKNKSEFCRIKTQIKHIMKKPVEFIFNEKKYSRRLRFFMKKTEYIITTIENIYLSNMTIKKILKSDECIQATRKSIIYYSCGLGPKQASMFLRNIGYYSEFAVLDKHVIDYMKIMGLTKDTNKSFSSISAYEKIETKLKSYAKTFNLNLLHLDLAIWTTMRILKYYQ